MCEACPGWGVIGSAADHDRYLSPSPRTRRRCRCGCNTRATHVGMANGVALMAGCEWSCRVWVRDGNTRAPEGADTDG